MLGGLSSDGRQFLETACAVADRFSEYQVDEESFMNQLGWEVERILQASNELEAAGYITKRGAWGRPQVSVAKGFWIEQPGTDPCPEPLGVVVMPFS